MASTEHREGFCGLIVKILFEIAPMKFWFLSTPASAKVGSVFTIPSTIIGLKTVTALPRLASIFKSFEIELVKELVEQVTGVKNFVEL